MFVETRGNEPLIAIIREFRFQGSAHGSYFVKLFTHCMFVEARGNESLIALIREFRFQGSAREISSN